MNICGPPFPTNETKILCNNAYCAGVNPVCIVGISDVCRRNKGVEWLHHSSGEHICNFCMQFFIRIGKLPPHLSIPQLTWLRRFKDWDDSFKNWPGVPKRNTQAALYDFVVNSFFPWWMKCVRCGRWRCLPIRFCENLAIINRRFHCSMISWEKEDSCSVDEDLRVAMVLKSVSNYLSSMKSSGLLHESPLMFLCQHYPPSLLGIEPPPLGLKIDHSKFQNWNSYFPPFRKPFLNPSDTQQFPGCWSPLEISLLERSLFPSITCYPPLYRALRNTVIYLWNRGKFRCVTPKRASRHLLIPGLLRVVMLDNWLPTLITQFTRLGLINIGFCTENTPTDELTQLVKSDQLPHVIIGPADLSTAVLCRQVENGSLLRTEAAASCWFSIIRGVPAQGAFSLDYFHDLPRPSVYDGWNFPSCPLGSHVIDPINNDVMVLSRQLSITRQQEKKPMLFYCQGHFLVAVLTDFHAHVERTVYRTLKSIVNETSVSVDPSQQLPIQHYFDQLCENLFGTDMENPYHKAEKGLCQYVLASIEERLMEQVLFSGHGSALSSTSLFKLTPHQLRSFLSDPDPEFYARALDLLTSGYSPTTFRHCYPFMPLVNGLLHSCNISHNFSSVAASSKGLFVFNGNSPDPIPASSVTVTRAEALRIIFCDNPLREAQAEKEGGVGGETSNFLSVYLPQHFRLPLPAEADDLAAPQTPLCIYVTLLYPQPWWRSFLSCATQHENIVTEGFGVDLDALPESHEPPTRFGFLPDGDNTRGFCHCFSDLTHRDANEEFGIIQTVIFGDRIDPDVAREDVALVEAVHDYLLQKTVMHNDFYQSYLDFSVQRFYLPSAHRVPQPLSIEVRSVRGETKAVDFDRVNASVVETDGQFQVTSRWWELLSHAAGIHVLPALLRNVNYEETALSDALSTDVRRGLRWAEHYVTEMSSQRRQWSASEFEHHLIASRDEAYASRVSTETSEDDLVNGESSTHSTEDVRQEEPSVVTEEDSEPEVRLRPMKRRFSSPEVSIGETCRKPLEKRLALDV